VPLKDRRQEYSWPDTEMADVQLITDKRVYGLDEKISASLAFRIIGGLRESFTPDVWTVAWEDYDKIVRLTYSASIDVRRGPVYRKLVENKKEVRRSSFYWSRDPDLPYRIWAMIMHEDGSAPQIPLNVEDAQSKMLDIVNAFEIDSSRLGRGRHALVGRAKAKWGRRSFIEKGEVGARSKPVAVTVE